jgi:1,2-diacylglycerol 3-alpha-glucosyltransferase
VERRGLDNLVRFTGPVYDREELRAVFAASDLMLFPSLYDNASLATREAAGFAIPTVFVNGATTANGIIDGKNGFLAENEPEEYASKIRSLLSDPGKIKAAGLGAREYLYISWEEIASQVYGKYEEIVARFKHRQINGILGQEKQAEHNSAG